MGVSGRQANTSSIQISESETGQEVGSGDLVSKSIEIREINDKDHP